MFRIISCFFCLLSLPAAAQDFRIGIFWPPVWKHTNEAQYRTLADAGVDFIQNVESTDLNTPERNLRMLDLAQAAGLKVYVSDPRVRGSDADIRAMVEAYRRHPATAGYYIKDEPDSVQLAWAIATYKTIASLDPDRVPHVNLFPDFAVKEYETNYVNRWVEGVGADRLKYLSFDIYPYKVKGRLEKTYYRNLDIIRKAGLRYRVPTSSYLQSFGIVGMYRLPTTDEMRLNVYSNLAYGIKNPVWFCYATPTGQGSQKFLNSVIDSLGQKTHLYEPFRQLNREMKQLGKTLCSLDAMEVFHTGDSLWAGTTPLPAGYFWQPEDRHIPWIITRFAGPEGREYVMVVNASFTRPAEPDFRAGLRSLREISKTDGRPRRVRRITGTFLPGEGRLYEIRRNH